MGTMAVLLLGYTFTVTYPVSYTSCLSPSLISINIISCDKEDFVPLLVNHFCHCCAFHIWVIAWLVSALCGHVPGQVGEDREHIIIKDHVPLEGTIYMFIICVAPYQSAVADISNFLFSLFLFSFYSYSRFTLLPLGLKRLCVVPVPVPLFFPPTCHLS